MSDPALEGIYAMILGARSQVRTTESKAGKHARLTSATGQVLAPQGQSRVHQRHKLEAARKDVCRATRPSSPTWGERDICKLEEGQRTQLQTNQNPLAPLSPDVEEAATLVVLEISD